MENPESLISKSAGLQRALLSARPLIIESIFESGNSRIKLTPVSSIIPLKDQYTINYKAICIIAGIAVIGGVTIFIYYNAAEQRRKREQANTNESTPFKSPIAENLPNSDEVAIESGAHEIFTPIIINPFPY